MSNGLKKDNFNVHVETTL